MVLAKVATVCTPITYKHLVDAVMPAEDPSNNSAVHFPVQWLLLYGLLRFASFSLKDFRDSVFLNVTQHACKAASVDTFNHIHRLSLNFHLMRKTGAVLSGLERGASGISYLLTFTIFNILPLFLELAMVCLVLLSLFSPLYPLIVFLAIVGYAVFTVSVTEWRNKFRREQNEKNNEMSSRALDSLINYETVKYFSNESLESGRYSDSWDNKIKAEMRTQNSLAFLNIGQNAIITSALVLLMFLAARDVLADDMTVGGFVMINTYLLQLYSPLNFLGTSYRMIKQSLVDLENMFELLQEDQGVKDVKGALPLKATAGDISFEDVTFSYGETRLFDNLSFHVPAGKMMAIVGPTGSGKSSLVRLIFRFYDIQRGKISIDDQNIQTVTQESLRKVISVVPQDVVLFNDTIFYNILYGRPTATAEEVYEAARLAKIHDFIMGLPDQYETTVGERGLRLSGGEKQRVSIARAILKQPKIIVFDEATSSLDTATEKCIQESLADVSKGRTTIVVAHRLSTIIDADEIIVLSKGSIVERGNHSTLLSLRGQYWALWQQQQQQQQHSALPAVASAAAAAPVPTLPPVSAPAPSVAPTAPLAPALTNSILDS